MWQITEVSSVHVNYDRFYNRLKKSIFYVSHFFNNNNNHHHRPVPVSRIKTVPSIFLSHVPGVFYPSAYTEASVFRRSLQMLQPFIVIVFCYCGDSLLFPFLSWYIQQIYIYWQLRNVRWTLYLFTTKRNLLLNHLVFELHFEARRFMETSVVMPGVWIFVNGNFHDLLFNLISIPPTQFHYKALLYCDMFRQKLCHHQAIPVFIINFITYIIYY
jgi:hypothetical protein